MLPSPAMAPADAANDEPPQAPPDRPGEIQHAEFLGLRFALLTQRQALHAILENTGAPYRYVVTPNAYHVVAAHEDPSRLLPIYRAAWLSLCDSRIIRTLARLDRHSLPLVTGSDLVASARRNGSWWSDPRAAPKQRCAPATPALISRCCPPRLGLRKAPSGGLRSPGPV
jgi:hypothetical protein